MDKSKNICMSVTIAEFLKQKEITGQKGERAEIQFLILHYSQMMNKDGHKKVLKQLRILIEKETRKVKSSCKKGCSHCCYMEVLLTDYEVDRIKRYIKEKKIKPNKERKGPGKGKCPFLSMKGECKIYEERPLACRNYLVINDPEDCRITEDGVVRKHFNKATEVLISSFWNTFGCFNLRDRF